MQKLQPVDMQDLQGEVGEGRDGPINMKLSKMGICMGVLVLEGSKIFDAFRLGASPMPADAMSGECPRVGQSDMVKG